MRYQSPGSIDLLRPSLGYTLRTQTPEISWGSKRRRWEQKSRSNRTVADEKSRRLNVRFSCACLPIKFASLIHGLIERAASECSAKSIFAPNVYECLGRQAFAAVEP
jgi:hypothetical protein